MPYPYQQPLDQIGQLRAQLNQPPMLPTQMSGTYQPPNTNQGLLWVSGEAGAKGYLVAPNSTVLLMDSEQSRFYLKSTDGSGMPNLRTFEYAEVEQGTNPALQKKEEDLNEKYCTRKEYNDLLDRYFELLEKVNNFPVAVPAETGKKSNSRSKGGFADE